MTTIMTMDRMMTKMTVIKTTMTKILKLTFIPVCSENSWHQFLLTVDAKLVANEDLVLRQLRLEPQRIEEIKLQFCEENH